MNIGLTQRVLYHKGRAYDSLDHDWYSYLKNHTLSFIANRTDQNFQKLAEELDCLILTGGNDPSIRRITETKLASEMMKIYKPVIGVCHGAFLLTELLGGIVQESNDHADTEHIIEYNNKQYTVNSFHSLQIKKVHSTATVLAVDQNGFCEAWIDGLLAGVVWHPERMKNPFLPYEIEQFLK